MWPVIALAGVGLAYLVRVCSSEEEETRSTERSTRYARDRTLHGLQARLGDYVVILDADGVEKMQGKIHSIDYSDRVIVLEVPTRSGQPQQYKAWLLKPLETVVKC